MTKTRLIHRLLLAFLPASLAAVEHPPPVTPSASPEAVALLDYLYDISGKRTMTGQHCAPLVGSTRLIVVQRQTGRYPALFGQDFGFDAAGAWDGINFRQRVVDEAIRRSHEGFVITLMWHAVPPTEDEPVEFRDSIQSDLTDAEWEELITPGTHLHERWKSQVDVIAWFLKQLQTADVPVLWRPYHEMNGDWFWWGKKPGENGYKKLYRMLFHRLVEFHGLKNLIWVYNANVLRENVDPYDMYFPGYDVVDVLATDVYRSAEDLVEYYGGNDYELMLDLADGRPIAMGEVGRPPTPAILASQPRWTWFMLWGDTTNLRGQRGAFRELYLSEEAVTLDELPWVEMEKPKMHYPIIK